MFSKSMATNLVLNSFSFLISYLWVFRCSFVLTVTGWRSSTVIYLYLVFIDCLISFEIYVFICLLQNNHRRRLHCADFNLLFLNALHLVQLLYLKKRNMNKFGFAAVGSMDSAQLDNHSRCRLHFLLPSPSPTLTPGIAVTSRGLS